MNRCPSILWGMIALSLACQRPNPECRSRVQKLRTRLAQIDWSLVSTTPQFDYPRVPVGQGRILFGPRPSSAIPRTVAIDGARVELQETPHPSDEPLTDWLPRWASRHYGVLVKERDPNTPLFLLATADTRLGMVRTVVQALQPIAVVHLAFRPPEAQAEPWPPSKKARRAFEDALHARPGESSTKRIKRAIAYGAELAAGCSDALDVVQHPAMWVYDRLLRFPNAFEKCGCGGDIDTLAALYWRETIEDNMRPIRWQPWDEALVQRLGDDATYADLVRAIAAKHSGSGETMAEKKR